MKFISIAAAGISVALIALTLTPAAGESRAYYAIGALVCSAVALVLSLIGWHEPASVAGSPLSVTLGTAAQSSANADAPLRSVKSAPPPVRTTSSEAELVGFLATFQEKGRLVDFLQDDITGYSDAQVGAAARVVHQGCRAVLREYFRIAPVREESEGTKVIVPLAYVADEYRLSGKISGEAPFSGTLMHRGWKAESVTLPRIFGTADDRLPIIAPAEVELR